MASRPAPTSLCLVRLSALGDVVLVVPLIRALQAQWPTLRITWVISRAAHAAVAGLAEAGAENAVPGVEFIVIDKPRGPGDYLAFRRQLAGRRFDVLLALQASWRANWLYPCIRARRKIGYGRDRAKDLQRLFVRETLPPARPHLVDGFLQFAEAVGAALPEQAHWDLPRSLAAGAWADTALPGEPFFAVSPCASKPERDWSPDAYAAVVAATHRRQAIPLVLLGGPSPRERAMADAILAKLTAPVLDLVGKTNVPQLMETLARCAVLLAPDTGAVHIARAFDRPVVGLYAVAPASRTGPYRRTGFCVDRFEEAVRTLLGRDPIRVPWAQRVHDPRAMQLIKIEDVQARIDEALAAGVVKTGGASRLS